jgi:hypothetical protein
MSRITVFSRFLPVMLLVAASHSTVAPSASNTTRKGSIVLPPSKIGGVSVSKTRPFNKILIGDSALVTAGKTAKKSRQAHTKSPGNKALEPGVATDVFSLRLFFPREIGEAPLFFAPTITNAPFAHLIASFAKPEKTAI